IHSVRYVMRIMPRLLATKVGIIVACAMVGEVLVCPVHIDPLTAYLSTTRYHDRDRARRRRGRSHDRGLAAHAHLPRNPARTVGDAAPPQPRPPRGARLLVEG